MSSRPARSDRDRAYPGKANAHIHPNGAIGHNRTDGFPFGDTLATSDGHNASP